MTLISPQTVTANTHSKEYIVNYWHKRAADFSQLRQKELHSAKAELWQQEICRHLPEKKSLRILDIGCGAGFFTILLSKLQHKVTGIDLTPEMIEAAKNLAAQENTAAEFLVMDAESTNFPSASFDVIIARNLMWNLPHPAKAYQEWLRLLKKDGLLLNYDAEYAKNHHSTAAAGAHADIAPELLEECHNIYHMLPISCYDRPLWDKQLLQSLGCKNIELDFSVNSTIYSNNDEFSTAVPMFCVKATKS